MKIVLLNNFLHFFNLKQGTVLIAILQLFITGFTLIFFVLAMAHAIGIQEMVVRDTEDALEREALEEISSNHLNTKRMDLAHHNATETVYSMYCGLVMAIIHFISTIMLLYGTLTNNRHCMTPWMVVMMIIISSLVISLFLVGENCPFIAILGGRANFYERMIVLCVVVANFYIWFVVYSTYKSLETKRGLMHEVHCVKKKYAVPALEMSKVIPTSAKKPFEV
ncbi:PREDICTED: uncharacterized protein LOC106743328 [Dinoponera quadriceps]|uniref:Uncharacterized protein LOC106743328 n=1 Tax=Dinoponera quadriceps TaxID=609295 RepID=A0A6P3X2M1_DINQU|nr:PREDICTED: uncharacterized protein LOC106743328 [Dinoponera quadriceps]XP_014472544.1 PREDICTED: uncharacterized protein LOC106743328 [Dinoponera quadriceps]XP_014472545.1 PREDICTED: uncharacterized protein LOC106743328 [Dinoponera quadriceps]